MFTHGGTSPQHRAEREQFPWKPIIARTRVLHRFMSPVTFNCVRVIVTRAGGAVLCSEFGIRHVNVGDVVMLDANILCGVEPEDEITSTTLYLDRDYVIDQVFWQYVDQFADRLDAKRFLDAHYAEPAQVIHLGEDRANMLTPRLDELVALSLDGLTPKCFFRAEALLFSVLDVIVPHMKITVQRVTATQRCTSCPLPTRQRRVQAVRQEANKAEALLRGSPGWRWTLSQLAVKVHLSQLS